MTDKKHEIYICEVMFYNKDEWTPVARFGVGDQKKEAKEMAMCYFNDRGMGWALNPRWDNTSRRIRFSKYRIERVKP